MKRFQLISFGLILGFQAANAIAQMPVQQPASKVMPRSLASVLNFLTEKHGLQIIMDGDLPDSPADVDFDKPVNEILDKVGNVYGYAWTKKPNGTVLLRRDFDKKEGLPLLSESELLGFYGQLNQILPKSEPDPNHRKWGSALIGLYNGLPAVYKERLEAGQKIPVRELRPADQSLVNQIIQLRTFGATIGRRELILTLLTRPDSARLRWGKAPEGADGALIPELVLTAADGKEQVHAIPSRLSGSEFVPRSSPALFATPEARPVAIKSPGPGSGGGLSLKLSIPATSTSMPFLASALEASGGPKVRIGSGVADRVFTISCKEWEMQGVLDSLCEMNSWRRSTGNGADVKIGIRQVDMRDHATFSQAARACYPPDLRSFLKIPEPSALSMGEQLATRPVLQISARALYIAQTHAALTRGLQKALSGSDAVTYSRLDANSRKCLLLYLLLADVDVMGDFLRGISFDQNVPGSSFLTFHASNKNVLMVYGLRSDGQQMGFGKNVKQVPNLPPMPNRGNPER